MTVVTRGSPVRQVGLLALLTLLSVSGCGGPASAIVARDSPSPQPTSVSASPVQAAEPVVGDQHDVLAPPSGHSPQLTAEQVRSVLIDSGDGTAKAYLSSPDQLTVSLGLYSNQDLRDERGTPTENVLSYVFTNANVDCGPSTGGGPPPVGQTQSPTPSTQALSCAAVIIADANTAKLLETWTHPT